MNHLHRQLQVLPLLESTARAAGVRRAVDGAEVERAAAAADVGTPMEPAIELQAITTSSRS